MNTSNPVAFSPEGTGACKPSADGVLVVGSCDSGLRFAPSHADALQQLPLPGIVIFVHGVNSDGEWYKAAEEGLCKGLNERLKRCNEHLAHPTCEGGQLSAVKYMQDLTADGFLNPDKGAETFIEPGAHFSPVIQFRWGFKADSEALQTFGDAIFLNEKDYWGGGPFANGCTALPDLWGDGLDDGLFLFLHAQHMNPTNDRLVYKCPPRAYYVLAALRLAKLIETVRTKQADVPITIVCHSQGNMVAMTAAFLGDRLPSVTDSTGKSGRCVADNYVLCNPPYSVVKSNLMQSFSEMGLKDGEGRGGRQTYAARVATLAKFFDIIRNQAGSQQPADLIDKAMKNEAHGFNAQSDREKYGYGSGPSTQGRVTLYFNPHDQVISATTIQGIGWRGMNADEIRDTKGEGVFCQRVFAQGYPVGKPCETCKPARCQCKPPTAYDFWKDHHRKDLKPKSSDFWYPPSPKVTYSLAKGMDANDSIIGKFFTVVFAPILYPVIKVAGVELNAKPPEQWATPLGAPPLPEPFEPETLRFASRQTNGKAGAATPDRSKEFDEGTDPPGMARDVERQRSADDPYAGDRPLTDKARKDWQDVDTDAARGTEESEAAMRYEHHAMLRLAAKREGRYGNAASVTEEDEPEKASEDYKAWRTKKIADFLKKNIDTHATDHSTIMTNAMHARRSLAYDVAVGVCRISTNDLEKIRIAADWRYLEGLEKHDKNKDFMEYFRGGKFRGVAVSEWSVTGEGSMPKTIANERTFAVHTYPDGGNG